MTVHGTVSMRYKCFIRARKPSGWVIAEGGESAQIQEKFDTDRPVENSALLFLSEDQYYDDLARGGMITKETYEPGTT